VGKGQGENYFANVVLGAKLALLTIFSVLLTIFIVPSHTALLVLGNKD